MKIGDYVRTNIGIGKIIKCNSIYFILDTDKDNIAHEQDEIIKSSPNIIDLIEVGDYVNGQKVIYKLYDELNKCWYLKLEIGEVFGKYARTYQQHIKSIVTKEQFESMEYRIGE